MRSNHLLLISCDHSSVFVHLIPPLALVHLCVTVAAQSHEVVGIESDGWVRDVIRSDVPDMVDSVGRSIDPTLHALLAESVLLLEVGLSARLPCFGFVKGFGVVLHKLCGSTHAPAVLWSLESYRHGLKEQAPDEKRLPTQKEITMKKLLAIKERPADGGQDAREKGDIRKKHCLFAILHPKLYQIQNMKYHVKINPSGSAEAPGRE